MRGAEPEDGRRWARLIAEKIVELAQRGVQDVAALTTMTLKEFKRTD
jgi:hypothetical protein